MNLRSTRRAGNLIGLCWLVVATVVQQPAFAIRNLKIGDPFPAFSLVRADGTAGAYTSAQLAGQPAAIVFWRPGQKLSLEALTDLQAIAQKIGATKFRLICVDAKRSSAQEVQTALAGKTFSFPLLLDPQRTLYAKVGLIVCPTTLLLDAQGVLRFVVASHPRQFRQVVGARLRFLLGEIDEKTMDQQIKPTVLKIEHNLAAAWRMFSLGKKLQAEGKPGSAIAMYEKAVSQHPALTEARCALGFMKLEAGDIHAAAQHFQTALTHQPNSRVARLGQAAVLARTQKAGQAEHILLPLLGHRSIAVRVRYELGRIYHARGELEKAVAFYQDALATVFPEPRATPASLPSVPVGAPPAPSSQAAKTVSAAPAKTTVAVASPAAATPRNTAQAPAGSPVMPAGDASYIGVKRCKKCHLQQEKSWKKTKMAKTFDVLKPGAAADEKQSRGLDVQKDYTADPQCLRCHTNGFGRPGGYRTPPPGDARAARAAQANASVGCESCHGAGSKYAVVHKDVQDNKRQYTQAEFYKAGQYKIDEKVCAVCHDEKAPCIRAGYVFEFEKRKEEGTHKHYEMRFLAK